jgi:hypothetical protein
MCVRLCIGCDGHITGCFGFVIARDMLEYYEGKRRAEDIRELCGRCVLRFSIIDLSRGIDELNVIAFETLLRENPFPRSLAV